MKSAGARSRRRIAPGLISCAMCDRDLDEATAFRRIRRVGAGGERTVPASYCWTCEAVYRDAWYGRRRRAKQAAGTARPWKARRRVAPGLISCCGCDRDLDEATEFRRYRCSKRAGWYTASRCKRCEAIRRQVATDAWVRSDPEVRERRREQSRAWYRARAEARREEREWATGLLRADVMALVERGWSRSAIAGVIGANRSSVCLWAKGERLALPKTAARLHPVLLALRDAPVGGGS